MAVETGDSGPSLPKKAELYAIEKIEKVWHRATSKKNLDLMMSLWAPNAVITLGGKTYAGKEAISKVFSKAAPFQAQNPWVSETPADKTRVTVTGNRGTMYFECHYVDVDTRKVAAVVRTASRCGRSAASGSSRTSSGPRRR